jgi:hypothetical protein
MQHTEVIAAMASNGPARGSKISERSDEMSYSHDQLRMMVDKIPALANRSGAD